MPTSKQHGRVAGGGGPHLFTNEEDDIIKELVESSHEKPFTDWSSLEEKLPGRCGMQIQDRWANHLNPVIDRSRFGKEDDMCLKNAHAELGPEWKDISDRYFQGRRSENQLKNRFHSAFFGHLMQCGFSDESYRTWAAGAVVRSTHRHPFGREDDISLSKAHQELGPRWRQISDKYFHGTRSEYQLQNRYHSTFFEDMYVRGFPEEAYDEGSTKFAHLTMYSTKFAHPKYNTDEESGDEGRLTQRSGSSVHREAQVVHCPPTDDDIGDEGRAKQRSGSHVKPEAQVIHCPFTKDEDDIIKEAVAKQRSRSNAKPDAQVVHCPFTKDEDDIIKEAAGSFDGEMTGFAGWQWLAKKLPGKTGRQVRERWTNHLDRALSGSDEGRSTRRSGRNSNPGARVQVTHGPANPDAQVMHDPFTEAADATDVTKRLSFNADTWKVLYTEHEDEIIKATVEKSADKPFTAWSSLATYLPGREGKQIRDRWVNYLNPALNHSPFGREDDLRLKEGYDDLGSKWKAIGVKYFQGTRSENQIKNRYHGAVFRKLVREGFPEDAYDAKVDKDSGHDERQEKNKSNSTSSTSSEKEADGEETINHDKPLEKENCAKAGGDGQRQEKNERNGTSSTSSEKEADGEHNTNDDNLPAKETGGNLSSLQATNQNEKSSTPPETEVKGEGKAKDDVSLDEEQHLKDSPCASQNQSKIVSTKGESKSDGTDDKVVKIEGFLRGRAENNTSIVRDHKSLVRENGDSDPSTESKKQSKISATPATDDDAGKTTDEDEVVFVSSTEKRKLQDETFESLAKKRRGDNTRPHNQQPSENFSLPQNIMNPMMNPQVANFQMINQQMMNQQMMYWGQQMPSHQNIMQGMIPPNALANAAAQQQMMLMMGQRTPHTSLNPLQPVPQGRCHRAILTLPPPNTKLGILLDDNTTFGLPELKGVATNSPIRPQIPEEFQSKCCIVSMKSQEIGTVEPKTAKQCANLIARSQRAATKPCFLEVVLVEATKKTGPTGPIPIPKPKPKRGRKTASEEYEYNRLKRTMLLDFYSDEDEPSLITFIRRQNLPESFRSVMTRVINSDKRLTQLFTLRHVSEHRKEAYDIIEKIFPDVHIVRDSLLDFFTNTKYGTLDTFCQNKNLDQKVREAMEKMIANDMKLSLLVDQRAGEEGRKEAVKMIHVYFPDTSSGKIKFDHKHKTLLLELFTEYRYASVQKFCKEKKIDTDTCTAMVRFVDNDIRLSRLMGQRRDSERREEAINAIEKLFGRGAGRPTLGVSEGSEASDSTPAANERSGRIEFFSPANIKNVAEKLDFGTRPRISRDETKEIEIHDKKALDERLTLLLLDFLNRVVRGRILSKAEKDKVCCHCGHILFYDHGYKKVSGVSMLDRTWGARLEQAYISGADISPLQRRHKGSDSYIDRVERDHPGLIRQLYEYAEMLIGKDAPFGEKAMIINEKSIDNPAMPDLQLNRSNLNYWVNGQRGKRAEGVVQSKSEGDSTIDQVEKQHPGLIEELYKFAVEAMGPDASFHILATCMNERSKEDVEECPTLPLVVMSKLSLPQWLKKRGL